jgi:hypothetical protein
MNDAKDPCKCGHPFSLHTRNIRETDTMRVDDALLPEKEYDILSDKPAGGRDAPSVRAPDGCLLIISLNSLHSRLG